MGGGVTGFFGLRGDFMTGCAAKSTSRLTAASASMRQSILFNFVFTAFPNKLFGANSSGLRATRLITPLWPFAWGLAWRMSSSHAIGVTADIARHVIGSGCGMGRGQCCSPRHRVPI